MIEVEWDKDKSIHEKSDEYKQRPELPWDDSCGDHIRIIDGLFDENICGQCIEQFDNLEEHGLTHSRRSWGSMNLAQQDESIFWTECDTMIHRGMQEIGDYVQNTILESWQIKYPLVDSGVYAGLQVSQMKIQKTRQGEGYHNWHFEGGSSRYDRTSILAFMIYLNDVEEGGETEFLYQGVRVPPKQGRFICWPGGFTHIHRGNPPLTNTKYAITGWINYVI